MPQVESNDEVTDVKIRNGIVGLTPVGYCNISNHEVTDVKIRNGIVGLTPVGYCNIYLTDISTSFLE